MENKISREQFLNAMEIVKEYKLQIKEDLKEINNISPWLYGGLIAVKGFTPIDVLELSVRSTNCLRSEKINTVEQLLQLSEKDLKRMRSFGRKSLVELKEALDNYINSKENK